MKHIITLLLLLIAFPSYAIERGDHRPATGVTLMPTEDFGWGRSGYIFASACSAAPGNECSYLTEGSEGSDNEYDWLDDQMNCDPMTACCFDNDSNDLWSSPALDLAAEVDRYSIACTAIGHPIDSWELQFQWNELPLGTPVSSVQTSCGTARAFQGTGGRTYRPWLSSLTSWEWNRIDLTFTCGTTVKTWDSITGGAIPQIALVSDQPCLIELDVQTIQTNDQTSRVASHARIGVDHWPTQQQGGGCGLGVELLLVLPLLAKKFYR